MPVRKFRSVEEMGDIWREPGPALWRAIASVWAFGARTLQPRFPPGIHKHRSMEDAERMQEIWQQENFRRFRERRGS